MPNAQDASGCGGVWHVHVAQQPERGAVLQPAGSQLAVQLRRVARHRGARALRVDRALRLALRGALRVCQGRLVGLPQQALHRGQVVAQHHGRHLGVLQLGHLVSILPQSLLEGGWVQGCAVCGQRPRVGDRGSSVGTGSSVHVFCACAWSSTLQTGWDASDMRCEAVILAAAGTTAPLLAQNAHTRVGATPLQVREWVMLPDTIAHRASTPARSTHAPPPQHPPPHLQTAHRGTVGDADSSHERRNSSSSGRLAPGRGRRHGGSDGGHCRGLVPGRHPGRGPAEAAGARTRLRKLLDEHDKASGAATGSAAGTAAAAERSPHAKASYDASEFESLAAKFAELKWRMISKPGGATVKPDPFYKLYALAQQATAGDNASERPMWAERGGLDFEGRARWDAWAAVKGLAPDKARLRFVKLYYETLPSCFYQDTRGGAGSTPAAA